MFLLKLDTMEYYNLYRDLNLYLDYFENFENFGNLNKNNSSF